nr:MAG TPA: hypothetical protein [Caudoviricetes sp.]
MKATIHAKLYLQTTKLLGKTEVSSPPLHLRWRTPICNP